MAGFDPEKICLSCLTVFAVDFDLHVECVRGCFAGSSCSRAVDDLDQGTEVVADNIQEIVDGP